MSSCHNASDGKVNAVIVKQTAFHLPRSTPPRSRGLVSFCRSTDNQQGKEYKTLFLHLNNNHSRMAPQTSRLLCSRNRQGTEYKIQHPCCCWIDQQDMTAKIKRELKQKPLECPQSLWSGSAGNRTIEVEAE